LGQKPSILECVFTDEVGVVEKVDCTVPLGKSDHMCLEFSYLAGADVKPTCERTYWRTDHSVINSDLCKFDWQRSLENKYVSEMWKIFNDTVMPSCENVSFRKPFKKAKSSWMTKETLKEIKKRGNAW